jgi:hypothetical protein
VFSVAAHLAPAIVHVIRETHRNIAAFGNSIHAFKAITGAQCAATENIAASDP